MSYFISEFTVCNQKNTIFIDDKIPTFSWIADSDRKNVFQKSYRIMVGCGYGMSDMWDSREVSSDQSCHIVYCGKPLLPCTEYYARVTVKNNFEETAEYDLKFETAFLCDDLSSWDGAEFIGAPEYYVCSETLGVFSLESDITIDSCGQAGIIFGADDYRLENRNQNEMLLEGPNYILVSLDTTNLSPVIHVFRTGYSADDKKKTPLASFSLSDSARESSCNLKLYVTGNCMNITVNNVLSGRVVLNPLGENDVTTYPRLCHMGYYASQNTHVHFSGIKCRFIREPANIFYECDTEKGITVFSNEDTVIKRFPDCHALPMLRRNYKVTGKVKKARLYVTSRGIYECRINGEAISDEYFAPGASQFDKHLYYQVYDVSGFLHEGENGIGFTLSSGWWSGSQTFVLGCYNLYGDKESIMAKLVISYADGSSSTIVTNVDDWDYYGEGAYKFAGFFQGERLDGRRLAEYYRFSMPDFTSEQLKKPVIIVPGVIPAYDSLPGFFRKYPEYNRTSPRLTGRNHCPVKAVEEIPAVSMTSPANGVYIYDLGQEIAGVCKIRFHGTCGETAVIRYAEMLYPDLPAYRELSGRILTANLRDASSTDKYILCGDTVETYSPKFTFHGFRYIEISGIQTPPDISEVIGVQLSSIPEITGRLETDNVFLNRFVKNVQYSQLCNFISIPTDCPQRNERMGWAGDAHVFCKTAMLNADVKQFYLRYLEALTDGQEENGNLPEIAPVGGGFGGITYGSALLFMVNDIYAFDADKQVIAAHYAAMKKYMDYLSDYDLPGAADMGPVDDWLAFEKTDSHLVWNAFYGRDCALMAHFADILGYSQDKKRYMRKFTEAKKYFNDTFFDNKRGVTLALDGTVNDSMGSYAIALAYEMLNRENIPAARKRLARKVRQSDYRITTGFFCTGLVNSTLSEGGFPMDAYRMMTQTDFPSWLYPVTQGATTVWERWNSFTAEKGFDGMNAMNSFNHYSLGSILSYLYEYGLGIRHAPETAGWKRFIIRPDFCGFTKISGWFHTPYGRIESSYEMVNGTVKFCCSIPVNTEAEIVLPNTVQTLGSGKYCFEFPLPQ